MTDLASIVFVNEGEILQGAIDADVAYDRLIHPWKIRLGLLYIEHRSLWLDLRILWLTLLALVACRRALAGVARLLEGWQTEPDLPAFCRHAAMHGVSAR